jgi:hypothetical protein
MAFDDDGTLYCKVDGVDEIDPGMSEEALSDMRDIAYADAEAYNTNAYKIPGLVADNVWRHDRRRRRSTTHLYDPECREANNRRKRKTQLKRSASRAPCHPKLQRIKSYKSWSGSVRSFIEDDEHGSI